MIAKSSINSAMPDAVTAATELTTLVIGRDIVERQDMSSGLNSGATLVTQKEKKNAIARRMVKVAHSFVDENTNLSIATPYQVTAHLVITNDTRYTKKADLAIVLSELLSWCLSKESVDSEQNVLRLAQGEL